MRRPLELMERARDAAYWTPGLTLARLAEEGLWARIEREEKAHGGPFRDREHGLVGGRPIGS